LGHEVGVALAPAETCRKLRVKGMSMSQRLVYVVGPSGAGKDSVLGWVRHQLASRPSIHWARRTITRALKPGDEVHEAVDELQFLALRERDAFVLDWQANGLYYGIRHSETAPLNQGDWVFLNGSRAHLDITRDRFPGLAVVHVSASPNTLRQRLLTRGREDPAQVEARIHRTQTLPPIDGIEILNDGTLEDAGRLLLNHLHNLPGWPK
jgi:ribose 1,5-bisphosphokinase